MSLWSWVLLACGAAYAIKAVGYLLPAEWLAGERVGRVTATVTIALLACLVTLNAVNDAGALVWDARLVALGAAFVALMLRAPYLVVVIIGAVAAGLARLLGLP